MDADEIIDFLGGVDASACRNEDERGRVLLAARDFIARLERPIDQVYRLTWMEPAYICALKVLTDNDLFTKWVAAGENEKTMDELAALCDIEIGLLSRLIRHVCAMNGLFETAQDTYSLTSFSRSLAGPGSKDAVAHMFDVTYPAFMHLPEYLAGVGYRNPTESGHGNWQDLKKSPLSYIQYVSASQERTERFHNIMAAYSQGKGSWSDNYPLEDLFAGLKSDTPAIVDIGGGKGYDLRAFREKFPQMPDSSFILQDLPEVVASVSASPGFKVISHDIMTPQPVKGALLYFISIVLHDFSDEDALAALKNTAAAMEPGYSKLILHEKVVSDVFSTPDVTSMDLMMMALFSAGERSERSWRDIITQAGMKVNRIHITPALFEAIIEAEVRT